MNCPACGRLLAAGTTRCPQCGAHIGIADRQPMGGYAPGIADGPREPQPANPFEWYMRVLSKYAEFDGRARRSEYWWFFVMNIVVNAALAVVGFMIHMPWIYFVYSLAVLIPGFAVGIRRLHDIGRSGWWWLICLVPIIGAIVLLVFSLQDSQPGTNQYGPNPKTDWA